MKLKNKLKGLIGVSLLETILLLVLLFIFEWLLRMWLPFQITMAVWITLFFAVYVKNLVVSKFQPLRKVMEEAYHP